MVPMINPTITFAGGVISMIGSVGYGVYKQKQLEKAINKLSDTSVNLDLSDPIIKEIVDVTIKREVDWRMDAASTQAIAEVRSDMSKQIKTEVNKAYSDLRASVKEEMKRQVGKIDISEIRKEVIEEAKVTAAEKFKSDLDSIIEKTVDNYNAQIKQVTSIYESISNTLQANNSKGTTLTIG